MNRSWLGVSLLVASAAAAQSPKPVSYTRLALGGGALAMRLPIPGIALIADSAQWQLLWTRFQSRGFGPNGPTFAPLPPVDFSRQSLLAVSLGGWDGCLSTSFVRRLTETKDSLVVEYGYPDLPKGTVTCDWLEWPVDLVLLPKVRKPLKGMSRNGPTVATPPPWWDNLGVRDLPQIPEAWRGAYLQANAVDPRTTFDQLLALADWAGAKGDFSPGAFLIEDRRIRTSPRALVSLMGPGDGVGRTARDLLSRFSPDFIATDTTIPAPVVRTLVAMVSTGAADSALTATLARTPRVLADSQLLVELIDPGRLTPAWCEAALGHLRHGWLKDTTSEVYRGLADRCRPPSERLGARPALPCQLERTQSLRPGLVLELSVRATQDSVADSAAVRDLQATHSRTRRTSEGPPAFAQLFSIVRVEGDLDQASWRDHRRVAVVWWSLGPQCERSKPSPAVRDDVTELFLPALPSGRRDSAAEAAGSVVPVLRPKSRWIGAMPTFDVAVGDWTYSPGRSPAGATPSRGALSVAEYRELFARLPVVGAPPDERRSRALALLRWGDEDPRRWVRHPAASALCRAASSLADTVRYRQHC